MITVAFTRNWCNALSNSKKRTNTVEDIVKECNANFSLCQDALQKERIEVELLRIFA